MKVAIMQPYFMPYIGYFQLINAVDKFVIYDNIKYTKKGWINRNLILQNGKDVMFSLPLKKDSDYRDVYERELSAGFDRDKLLNQIRGAYQTAPYFTQIFPLIEQIVGYEDTNLFRFLHHSIVKLCAYLNIRTEISISSSINIDHGLKNQDKVIALCEALSASSYVNSMGGIALYSKKEFTGRGITLNFIHSKKLEYTQFRNEFVPWLSIIDVMMFNQVPVIQSYISTDFELV